MGGLSTVIQSGDEVIIGESIVAADAPRVPGDACKTVRAM